MSYRHQPPHKPVKPEERIRQLEARVRELEEALEQTTMSPRAYLAWRRAERLEEALAPFAHFADQYERAPLRGAADTLYGIHTGTEFEAELKLSDCRAARDLLKR